MRVTLNVLPALFYGMRMLRFVGVLVWVGLNFSSAAFADDAGPSGDLRTLRHDAPILLAARILDGKLLGGFAIDGVVVNSDAALLQWHLAQAQRIDYFVRRFGVWWLEDEVWIDERGRAMGGGGAPIIPGDENGPTPSFLKDWLHFPAPLVDLAAVHLPSMQQAVQRAAARKGSPHFHGDGYFFNELPFVTTEQLPTSMGGYGVVLRFAPNDAPAAARLTRIQGRAPTLAESWVNYGADGYFFFSGTVQSAGPVHFSGGTTIDVWFPFVLDSSLEYSLTIANTTASLGRVVGNVSVATNTVHFELPAFEAAPNANLIGEVDADPRSHR